MRRTERWVEYPGQRELNRRRLDTGGQNRRFGYTEITKKRQSLVPVVSSPILVRYSDLRNPRERRVGDKQISVRV